MDTTTAVFAGSSLNFKDLEKQQAELYCKLYPIAAEDFVSQPDMQNFVKLTTQCIHTMQEQISELMQVLAGHKHSVPPHTHPLEPHTHTDPVSGTTGPNIGGYVTLPTPLMSNVPVESSAIHWTVVSVPIFANTTGAITNIEGNKVIEGPSQMGPLYMGKRRLKTPIVLEVPTILPVVSQLKLG